MWWTHQRWISTLCHLLALFEETLWSSLWHLRVYLHRIVLFLHWWTAFHLTSILRCCHCVDALVELFRLCALLFVSWISEVGSSRLDGAARAHDTPIVRFVLCRSINTSSLVEPGSVRGRFHRRIPTFRNGSVHFFNLKFSRISFSQLLYDACLWFSCVVQVGVSTLQWGQTLWHKAIGRVYIVRLIDDSRAWLWKVMTETNLLA